MFAVCHSSPASEPRLGLSPEAADAGAGGPSAAANPDLQSISKQLTGQYISPAKTLNS